MKQLNSFKNYVRQVPLVDFSIKEIKKSCNNFLGQEKIAMFHTGRCGSSVLANMLNAHSKIFWANEIFEKFMRVKKEQDGEAFVTNVIHQSCQSKISTFYGFETKYLPQQHLRHKVINMDLETYLKLLREIGFSKFIILQRKNYLKRAISAEVGKHKKRYHSKQDVRRPEKIYLDPEPILALFRCIDENFSHLKMLLEPSDHLLLYYEDHILQNPRIAYTKTCEFLNIDDESPKIELRRTNPFKYEDIVVNFEEIKTLLKDTKYNWMLDDDEDK